MAKAAVKSKGKAKPAKKPARKITKKLRAGAAPLRPIKLQSARKEQASRFKRIGSAQLSVQGGAPVEFPIYKAVEGANVIDISKLYASTGHFTFDPGFLSTASCDSEITYIDGDKGILRYRAARTPWRLWWVPLPRFPPSTTTHSTSITRPSANWQ